MKRYNTLSDTFLKSPILWGALASAGFYALVRSEVLSGQLIQRYFASHPVEYVTTVMFFVGLAGLLLKAADLLAQQHALGEPLLGPAARSNDSAGSCDALLGRLDRLPGRRQGHCLVRRLREALQSVRRRGSAEGLDDDLKYLADLDAGRMGESYALFTVIVWAIPILGFLGTVIGITLAIAKLAPEALENSLPEVTAGLGVAFDTTALSLALTIVLMFGRFLIGRGENALLEEVDRRATAELAGRFESLPAGPEGQVAAVRRMAQTMVEATERLVARQVEMWQKALDAAAGRWAGLAENAGRQLQSGLGAALGQSLEAHARQLTAAEHAAAESNRRHWDKVQQAQVQHAQALTSLQTALGAQADVLGRAVQAAGEVAGLQDALNQNLSTLAGAKHFEQTVMSLAAAIHLLNARLAEAPGGVVPVQLTAPRRTTHAA